jgi:hypothetical protein
MENKTITFQEAIEQVEKKIVYYNAIWYYAPTEWEKRRAIGIRECLKYTISRIRIGIKLLLIQHQFMTELQLELLCTEAIVIGHINNQRPEDTTAFPINQL